MLFRNRIEDKVAESYVESMFAEASEKKARKSPKKSMIRDLIDNPDGYELNAKIEDGEFVIRIKRRNADK